LCVFAPNLTTAEKINKILGAKYNLKSDGRPILGLDAKELLKILLDISPDIVMIPAHCLLPNTMIHTKDQFLKKIQNIKAGDLVFTHRNRWKKVQRIFNRSFKGKIYNIKPYYFREGLATTPEHPFYVIKTWKNCHWSKEICKSSHKDDPNCNNKYYKSYKPIWAQAKDLEKGDVLIFPRFRQAFDRLKSINLEKLLINFSFEKRVSQIKFSGTRANFVNKVIPITKNFCRLAGYYLAEGYTNSRDAIGFTFHYHEKEYINEVIDLIKKVFGFNGKVKKRRLLSKGTEIIFYSKILQQVFTKLFYTNQPFNAGFKALPNWTLGLSPRLQVEIFKTWWRGDEGYTSSITLMNQIKIILLRLGIIPSIYKETEESHKKRGNHFFKNREIEANYDCYNLGRLSFFEDKFNLLKLSEFKQFRSKSKIRHGWLDNNYVYLPIRNIETQNHKGRVYNLEVEEDNSYVSEFATVHNCWTPWFSIFGSKSGFNSVEECFDELAPHIFALETGLSSDPLMNWQWSYLDKYTLISNSDAHSPEKLGREANVFNFSKEPTYADIIKAIKTRKNFLYTIEFFPEEGKYHIDGHRVCNFQCEPAQTKKLKGICPVCHRPLTVGVLNRVAELADRDKPQQPQGAPNQKSIVPLKEIIAEIEGVMPTSKRVDAIYHDLIKKGENEFNVLLNLTAEEIKSIADPQLAEAIMKMRQGQVIKKPGYDGVFGQIKIFADSPDSRHLDTPAPKKKINKNQKVLF